MADAENHRPGEPPEIRDEAADTPMWLPALGLTLLLFAAIGIIYQSVESEQAAEESETTEVADAEEADADEGDAEEEADAPPAH